MSKKSNADGYMMATSTLVGAIAQKYLFEIGKDERQRLNDHLPSAFAAKADLQAEVVRRVMNFARPSGEAAEIIERAANHHADWLINGEPKEKK